MSTAKKVGLILGGSLLLLGAAYLLRLELSGLIPNFNPGIAFGLRPPPFLLFIFVPLLLVWLFWQSLLLSGSAFWGFFFILTGGIANFLERVFWGAILDWLALPFLPSFNLGDLAIGLGVLLLLKELIHETSRRFR